MGVLEVVDPATVHGRRPAYHAVDLVALFQEHLGQVGPILAGDAGDQRALYHRHNLSVTRGIPASPDISQVLRLPHLLEPVDDQLDILRAGLGADQDGVVGFDDDHVLQTHPGPPLLGRMDHAVLGIYQNRIALDAIAGVILLQDVV